MKEMLEFIAKSLVDEPDSVEVIVKETDQTVSLKLYVAEGDKGKVIGKRGRVANAIRTVMKSAGSCKNKKVVVDIV